MFNIDLDRSAIVQVTGHEKSAPIEKLISRLLVTQVRISIQWTHSHIWADCSRFHKMGISFMSLWPLYPVLHHLWFFGFCLSLLLFLLLVVLEPLDLPQHQTLKVKHISLKSCAGSGASTELAQHCSCLNGPKWPRQGASEQPKWVCWDPPFLKYLLSTRRRRKNMFSWTLPL